MFILVKLYSTCINILRFARLLPNIILLVNVVERFFVLFRWYLWNTTGVRWKTYKPWTELIVLDKRKWLTFIGSSLERRWNKKSWGMYSPVLFLRCLFTLEFYIDQSQRIIFNEYVTLIRAYTTIEVL